MHNARMFTFGDGQLLMHPSKQFWAVDAASWGAAWGCAIAAVRNPRSGEHMDEYIAMAGLMGLSHLAGLAVMPVFAPASAGYPIYHYCTAATQ